MAVVDIFNTDKKYSIIYADPPWSYNNSGFEYSAAKQYTTMPTNEICNLNIKKLANIECSLFLWGTWPLLPESLEVMVAWGFMYKTIGFVWLKTRENVNQYGFLPSDKLNETSGMGFWTMSNTEFCLIGVKGNPRRVNTGIRQVIYSPLREHSRKPDEVRDRIVQLMGDLPRIELFARQQVEGWDCMGFDVDGKHI